MRDTLEGRTEKRVYVGNEHELHRFYLYGSCKVTKTKHVFFDEPQFSFLRKRVACPRVVEQDDESAEEVGTSERNIVVFVERFEEETSETENDEVRNESPTEMDQHDEASGEKTYAPLRRSTCVRKKPK